MARMEKETEIIESPISGDGFRVFFLWENRKLC